jgi:hypothetical protein
MKYGQRILAQAKKEIEKGLNDIQLCQALGIGSSTLYEWKQEHPEFSEVLSHARDKANTAVVNALYNRATGIKVKERHSHIRKDGKKTIKEVREIEKEIPPDTEAMKFFLKNRAPEDWRDRLENLIAMVNKEDIEKSAAEINKILENKLKK